MSVFYRYIRPKRLDKTRGELVTLPRGGIALRFEELPEGDLFFTYARCHAEDYFSKDVARSMTDSRAEVARQHPDVLACLRSIPWSQDTGLLVNAVIGRCQKMTVMSDSRLILRYMREDYNRIGAVLDELRSTNLHQERLAEAWRSAISGMWKTAYQENNK